MVTADMPVNGASRLAAKAGDDVALVQAAAAVKPVAFEDIVRLYQPLVRRLATRLLGWPDDVEDVTQEVFMTVLARIGHFRGDSELSTWIAAITLNRCRSWRRRLRVRWRAMRQLQCVRPTAGPAADQPALDEDHRQTVRAAVAALPARSREVVVLHYLEEMPLETIAQMLGIRKNAVEVRLHRARQQLEILLTEKIS